MDVERLLNEYRSLEVPYSEARKKRNYKEEYKKTLLALLMKEAERKGASSVSAQERDAYANPQYPEYLLEISTAVAEEELKRMQVKRVELEIEVWRTLQANERMERKSYGA